MSVKKHRCILLMSIFLVFLMTACGSNHYSGLTGKWAVDSVTKYEFREDGTGALVLPSESYEFTYQVKSKKMEIDFLDETLTDAKYEFTLTEDTLTWKTVGKNSSAEYILNREEE